MTMSVSKQRDPAYGWVVVAAAAILMGFGFGGLSIVAVFMKPLSAAFGWQRAEISMAYFIGAMAAAFGGLAFGQAADRWPPRPAVVLGALVMGLSLVSLQWLASLTHLYVTVTIFGAAGVASCSIVMNTTLSLWFVHHRGLAIGAAGAGAALGQGLVPYFAQVLISAVGWREAYLYLGLLYLGIGLAAALLVRRAPHSPATIDQMEAQAGKQRPLRPAESLSWMAAAPLFCCICMAIPIMHIAPLVSDLGFDPQVAASVMAVMMIAGAFGRVMAGRLADRIGALNAYLVVSFIQTFFAYWFVTVDGLIGIYAVAVVFGVGYAGVMTCLLVTTRSMVPARLAGTGLSITSLSGWAGMGLGAYLGGALFDWTGNYDLSYATAAGAGVVNLTILAMLRWRWHYKSTAMAVA